MTESEILDALRAECERVFPGGAPFKQDDQPTKVAAAITDLAGRKGRLDQLRIWQASQVDLRDPDARRRAGVRMVWEAVQKRAATLSPADAVGWARVVGLAMARMGTIDPPWGENEERSSNTSAALRQDIEPEDQEGEEWEELDERNEEERLLGLEASIAMHSTALQAIDVALRGVSMETNLLWWSQALYSKAAGREYRDIFDEAPKALLHTMASDLVTVTGPTWNPSVIALFVETSRRLLPDLDKRRPEGEWLTALLQPGMVVSGFDEVVRGDDTLLPISGWLVAPDAAAAARERGVERSGRWVVREYLRERMIAAWLAEGA